MDNTSNIAGVPILGISRHRLGTDGKGVTALVAFHGCPLRCKYCLNKACWDSADRFKRYTPRQLYEELKQDNLYFQATGGGVTFGGGEPCLQADFILDFRRLCGSDWKICVETSLNVDKSLIEKLKPIVDEWIVDTKAEDTEVYKAYTGVERQRFIDNVSFLVGKENRGVSEDKVTFKIPVIPGYVSEEQAQKSAEQFRKSFGGANVEVFPYVTSRQESRRSLGKKICEFLKAIRHEVADAHGVSLPEQECKHHGDCPGTCPVCDLELSKLQERLNEKGATVGSVSEKLQTQLASFNNATDKDTPLEEIPVLMGDIQGGLELWPFYGHKKIFFKECSLAGFSFHLDKDDELWDEIREGTQLALVRDKHNKHDLNAVAVALASDYNGNPDDFDFDFILGYIPRNENAELAAMMDAGYADKFSAEITSYKDYGSYNNRIRLTIYVESNEPELIRPDLLRACSLSTSELSAMVKELDARGTAYFKWGGFPPMELDLPIVGEKIVLVHHDRDSAVLYLMRVLVTGDDCSLYVNNPEVIHSCDDRASYILTNVMGPVRIENGKYEFLRGVDLKGFCASEYLSPQLSDGFKKLFASLG